MRLGTVGISEVARVACIVDRVEYTVGGDRFRMHHA